MSSKARKPAKNHPWGRHNPGSLRSTRWETRLYEKGEGHKDLSDQEAAILARLAQNEPRGS